MTAEELWRSVTGVSNAGRRRGRGKGVGKKVAKDLNKGQQIGIGKKNVVWPGLNAPVVKGKEIVKQRELPLNKEYQERIIKLRNEMHIFKPRYVHPLERGFSGTMVAGKWIGPPEPVAGEDFPGFDTKVLMLRPVFCMKGGFGKTKRFQALCVTGNKQGLVGFATGTSKEAKMALNRARSKAAQRMRFVDLFENHTIIHDFYSRFGAAKVFAKKQPPGFGIKAHRIIKAICEVVGIKDIEAEVQGNSKMIINFTKAFFLGLLHQKGFQQLADEKRLNVVEFRNSNDNFPTLMASPSAQCRKDSEIPSDEVLDFTMHLHEGRVKESKIERPLFWKEKSGWQNYLLRKHYHLPRERVRVQLIAKYGALESFLTIREKERIEAKKAEIARQKMMEVESEVQQEREKEVEN